MFATIVSEGDRPRAISVAARLAAHGLPIALTGGLAIEAQLRVHGRASTPRSLNDLDFVAGSFAAIPESVSRDYLLSHVHPFAPDGKMLLQLVDASCAVRVDLFRAFGRTLQRSRRLDVDLPFAVVAVEDLVARATANVCSALGRGRVLERKHASAFLRLAGLGRRDVLEEAWGDHREGLAMTFDEARREAARLVRVRAELLIDGAYSAVITTCDRCHQFGSFRPSPPEWIVHILGYR